MASFYLPKSIFFTSIFDLLGVDLWAASIFIDRSSGFDTAAVGLSAPDIVSGYHCYYHTRMLCNSGHKYKDLGGRVMRCNANIVPDALQWFTIVHIVY